MNKQELIEGIDDELSSLKKRVKGESLDRDERYLVNKEIEFTDRVLRAVKDLDEPETLSEEWIEEHMTDGHNVTLGEKVLYVENVEKLLVPKQENRDECFEVEVGDKIYYVHEEAFNDIYDGGFEAGRDYEVTIQEEDKPVIPQFAADWIELAKDAYDMDVIQFSSYVSIEDNNKSDSFKELVKYSEDNPNKIIKAYLDGYEVEEPKYYAKLKTEIDFGERVYLAQAGIAPFDIVLKGEADYFTLSQWSDIGIYAVDDIVFEEMDDD